MKTGDGLPPVPVLTTDTALRTAARFADLPPYAPIEPFEVLSARLGRPSEAIIKLDANENPYGLSPRARQALADLKFPHIYPDPESRALRAGLAQFTGLDAGWLMAGAGADELIDLLLRVLLEPGDRVINCPPTFGMYPFDTRLNAGQVINIPRQSDFSLDIPAIQQAVSIHQPKALFLTTPNNPDGSFPPAGEIETLLSLPVLVVIDEAYIEFMELGGRLGENLSRLSEVPQRQNLVVLRTFSKWAGLAGLRVGYGAFPGWLLPALWKAKQPYNVNVAAAAAALGSLEDLDYLAENVNRLRVERSQLYQRLQTIHFLRPYPSQANFILCQVQPPYSATEIKAALVEHGILVRYYDTPLLQNFIRISIGLPEHSDYLLKILSGLDREKEINMTLKIAFVLYEGLTALDFIGVYDPLIRLKTMGFLPDLAWDLCALTGAVRDPQGLALTPNRVGEPLSEYDLVILPGGIGSRSLCKDAAFLSWLQTASACPRLASVCTGALLLAAAGLLDGKHAATHPTARTELAQMGCNVVDARLVEDGRIITSGGVTAAIDLGLYLCLLLGGEGALHKIQQQMDYPHDLPAVFRPSNLAALPAGTQPELRRSHIERATRETQVAVDLVIDGTGINHIATGLPFLDHMLTQIAVHGLFDLDIQAHGDIQIDPHHTLEDIALTLGQAFQQALGDRAGLVRMAAADCPMDESLAWVAVDFSGRPYAVVQAAWHGPVTGGLPTSLFKHFLESFASQARCNLHARVVYGEDDHHQAEALFKALGRALDAATRLDPRRSGAIPSSKGVIL